MTAYQRRQKAIRLAQRAFERVGFTAPHPRAWYVEAAADAIERRLKREAQLQAIIREYDRICQRKELEHRAAVQRADAAEGRIANALA